MDLDLDLLSPQDKVIKFGGELITVKQPTTEQLFKMMGISKLISDIDTDNLKDGELEILLEKAKNMVDLVIPELADKSLNFVQVMALIRLVSEMTMPSSLKELESKGITVDSGLKEEATS